jgi:hypothetical protein
MESKEPELAKEGTDWIVDSGPSLVELLERLEQQEKITKFQDERIEAQDKRIAAQDEIIGARDRIVEAQDKRIAAQDKCIASQDKILEIHGHRIDLYSWCYVILLALVLIMLWKGGY